MTAGPVSLRAWRNAIFSVTCANGFAIATMLSRLPGIRDHLGIDPAAVGVMLAFFSAGSMVGLAFSGTLLHSLGAARLVRIVQPVVGVAMAGIGLTVAVLGSYAATAAVAVVFGAAVALSDVAMQVEGTANERQAGRAVLPFIHAGFSLGTVVGAGLGALAAQLDVPLMLHFGVVAVVVLVGAMLAQRWIPHVTEDAGPKPSRRERLAVWRQPRTYAIGLIVLCFAYIEGSANDWLTLGLVDERGFDQAGAALMLSAFTAAMTVGRFLGSPIVNRLGRMPVLIGSAVIAAAGLSLVIFVPTTWAVILGTVVWGLGSSLGWPLGISAAGDDPVDSASRVSAVSILAYIAFFAGPPVVGLIANGTGVLPALTFVLGLVAIAIALSPAVRERTRPGLADPFADPAEPNSLDR